MMQKISTSCLQDRISNNHSKRILSLDGGGTKGIVTLAMLTKLESSLKNLIPASEKDDFRLNQYFDYIGGTSTGSIIAVLLSFGYSVDAIIKLYLSLSAEVFGFCSRKIVSKIFTFIPGYRSKPIESYLKLYLGDIKLGDEKLMNLLAVFTKNTSSNNIWTFNNNPNSRFFKKSNKHPDVFPNKDQYLKDLIRASTAAPVYFPPKELITKQDSAGKKSKAYFIDGGVSMDNNPAFRLFMMATLPYYNLDENKKGLWETREDKLLLMSFGTGIFTYKHQKGLKSLIKLPDMYIQNSSQTTDTILRGLSRHKNEHVIDQELKDLEPENLGNEPSLTYLRYNFKFRGLPNYNDDWSDIDKPNMMTELFNLASAGFDFPVNDITEVFLEHYYDWEGRLIDGCAPQ